MIKLVVLIRRRAGVSRAEFRRIYEHEHAPLAARVIPPEIDGLFLRYLQNHAVEGTHTEPAYDCVTEIAFADVEGVRRWTEWYRSDAGRVLREDDERFMDTSRRVVVLTEERPITVRA